MAMLARLAFAWLVASSTALAQGPTPPPGMSQGELLYGTHCVGCHTKEIHWREKKLAKDWPTLVEQVRRWQASGHLNWGEEEIAAVAHYLNAAFYRYPEPAEKKIGEGSPVHTPQAARAEAARILGSVRFAFG
jgi:mono/diheme cytochrome c family protein